MLSLTNNTRGLIWIEPPIERNIIYYDHNDPYFNQVVLLLPMNGANNSTQFIDVSNEPKLIQAYADTKISNGQNKFGGTSGYFKTPAIYNTDYLSTYQHQSLILGTNDFCIDLWIYIENLDFARYLITGQFIENGSPESFELAVFGDGSLVYTNKDTVQVAKSDPGAITTNTWYHVALSRESGYARLFIDGTIVDEGSDIDYLGEISNYNNNYWNIGYYQPDYWYYGFHGYMQDLRITKGVARYTTNFSVPIVSAATLSPLARILPNELSLVTIDPTCIAPLAKNAPVESLILTSHSPIITEPYRISHHSLTLTEHSPRITEPYQISDESLSLVAHTPKIPIYKVSVQSLLLQVKSPNKILIEATIPNQSLSLVTHSPKVAIAELHQSRYGLTGINLHRTSYFTDNQSIGTHETSYRLTAQRLVDSTYQSIVRYYALLVHETIWESNLVSSALHHSTWKSTVASAASTNLHSSTWQSIGVSATLHLHQATWLSEEKTSIQILHEVTYATNGLTAMVALHESQWASNGISAVIGLHQSEWQSIITTHTQHLHDSSWSSVGLTSILSTHQSTWESVGLSTAITVHESRWTSLGISAVLSLHESNYFSKEWTHTQAIHQSSYNSANLHFTLANHQASWSYTDLDQMIHFTGWKSIVAHRALHESHYQSVDNSIAMNLHNIVWRSSQIAPIVMTGNIYARI